jgi:hypothetical protein
MHNATERQLFSRLLCECGDCQRLPLSSCACSWADDMRAHIRKQLATGKSPDQIQNEYRAQFGGKALAILLRKVAEPRELGQLVEVPGEIRAPVTETREGDLRHGASLTSTSAMRSEAWPSP